MQFNTANNVAASAGGGVAGHMIEGVRSLKFHRIATIVLSLIGFWGLYIGLTHLLNGHRLFALALAFIFQGVAVSTIHAFKKSRRSGGSLRWLRGWHHLALFVIVMPVIVTMSYSFWYRLQRADEASKELFAEKKQVILSKHTQLETHYKAVADGFAMLADAAASRATEEKTKGNTCKIFTPGSPGPIQRFRERDANNFRDYAKQVDANVKEIIAHGDGLRRRALGSGEEIKATESALNEMVARVNAGLIGNPLLPGIVTFIDAQLEAGKQIDYYGQIVDCADEQRTSQLIALKSTIQQIMNEPPISFVKLHNPDSTYENAMLAANRIIALIEWASPFSEVRLSDLDPSIRDAKLANGMKVYVAPDYWPLLLAAAIELILFVVVPASRRDDEMCGFIRAAMSGNERLFDRRTVGRLLWLALSTPIDEKVPDEAVRTTTPVELPVKFLRLRPYLFPRGNHFYLVIPHALETALVHDYASALVLTGHAKTIIEEGPDVGVLPPPMSRRLQHMLFHAKGTGTAVAGGDSVHHDVSVRIMEVSREFFAWVIGHAVEMDEALLRQDTPQQRQLRAMPTL